MNYQPAETVPDVSAEKAKRMKEVFAQIERKLKAEFRRFRLTHHEQNLATVIVEESYGRQQLSVCVPQQTVFTALTGIKPNLVCPTLQRLTNMRMLSTDEGPHGPIYRISLETDKWQVAPRAMPDEIRRALDTIRRLNPPKTHEQREASLRQLGSELKQLIGDDGENSEDSPTIRAPRFVILETGSVLENVRDEDPDI